MSSGNQPWELKSFLDALIVELDRAQDTLAVKGMTRPLTYSVKDLSLDLQIFPKYDGQRVEFLTAAPGESGAAAMKFQLGSVTASTIRDTTRKPPTREDVAIDDLPNVDPEVKRELQSVGVTSATDVARLENSGVDITRMTGGKVNYGSLATQIKQARRAQLPPTITGAHVSNVQGVPTLHLQGTNLDVGMGDPTFPIAHLDGHPLPVVACGPNSVSFALPESLHDAGLDTSSVRVALDPYAVVHMSLEGRAS